MVHPDYESFQIPADVQEEYRKLVVQKRIVKWADGNEYDAEMVDAAIESGEISTTLTAQEIERLKQILWAKEYMDGAVNIVTDVFDPDEADDPLTLEAFGLTESAYLEKYAEWVAVFEEIGGNELRDPEDIALLNVTVDDELPDAVRRSRFGEYSYIDFVFGDEPTSTYFKDVTCAQNFEAAEDAGFGEGNIGWVRAGQPTPPA